MDYQFLLSAVENVLGKSYKKARDNHAFHCPFCNHRKPKLEINFRTSEDGSNPWECWVCETRGRTIHSLLRQMKVPREEAAEVLKYTKRGSSSKYEVVKSVELPKEYQLLCNASSTSVIANTAKKYLYDRGLSDFDFIKYRIGYATTGEYGGRIIIPSFSGSNHLNFFVARSFDGNYYKYKNPEASKDIIFFENLINWNQPIILCEGAFDAIAIKRNAVPILGKNMAQSLLKKIISSPLTDIYIALDSDAINKAVKYCEKFLNMGKRVFLVDLGDKDPSEMGFKAFTEKVQEAEELDFSSLMMYKLDL